VQLAEKAETLSRGLFDLEASRAVAAVARAAALIGDVDAATALVDMLNDSDQQEATIAVAEAAAAAGKPDAAISLADRLEDNSAKLRALSAAIAAGDPSRGLLEQAHRLATALPPDDYSRSTAMEAFVTGLVRAGELDEAEARAQTLESDDASELISAVSAEEARTGYSDRAEALARTPTTDQQLARALSAVAAGLADAGQARRAQTIIGTIPVNRDAFARRRRDPDHPPPLRDPERLEALLPTARALARAGDINGAQRLASGLPRQVKAQALLEVARIALIIEPARAADLANSAKRALASIPYYFEDIATGILEVRSLAVDSDVRDLLAHARSTPNKRLQEEIARAIDEALRAGNAVRARQYLTVLLTTDGWLLGFDALATLEPEAVRKIVRALRG
jgi:hypothetical protein